MNKPEDYISIVSFFAKTLPNTFEIIMFDTTARELPILYRANRMNGTQKMSREIVARVMKSAKATDAGRAFGCPALDDYGKTFRVSVYLIKDESNAVVGAVSVNTNCDAYFHMQSLASGILQFSNAELELPQGDTLETSYGFDEQAQPSLEMIETVVSKFGVEPGRISMNERTEIIVDLYDMGVFELKGAVTACATALKVSEQSVYRYLAKIKKARSV